MKLNPIPPKSAMVHRRKPQAQTLLFAALSCISILAVLALHPSASMLEPTVAAKGKPSPSPTPSNQTTSTIYDKSVDDLTFLDLRSDDLNPDLTPSGGTFGIYGTSTTNGVYDRLEGAYNSDWSLHLEDSATRWINLSLNRLSGSGPTGDYTLHARVISRCFDPSGATTGTVGWPTITTSNPNCSMHINFTIAGNDYGLIMSPYYANTGRAIVSCNALSGGQCTDWSIIPNLTQDNLVNPNPLVADLFLKGRAGKRTLVGTYSLTYRIRVTRP